MSAGVTAVVVDTTVFGAPLARRADGIVELYGDDLAGMKLLISFQTVAEMRYGALTAHWGARRVEELEARVASTLTVPPHDELANEWATLRFDCRETGHAFQDGRHSADLWIAATARLFDLPLVTHDSGFRGVPGLEVICHV